MGRFLSSPYRYPERTPAVLGWWEDPSPIRAPYWRVKNAALVCAVCGHTPRGYRRKVASLLCCPPCAELVAAREKLLDY